MDRLAAAGILTIAMVLLGACEDAATKARRAGEAAHRSLIIDAKLALEQRLKDPRSVQYGAVTVSRRSGAPVVCGAYNAKNSFGGYSGEKPFFMMGQVAILPGDLAAVDYQREWQARC